MGKYNYITRKVVGDIYTSLKDGYRYFENDTNNTADINVGDYDDQKSGLEFYLQLQVEFDRRFSKNILVDGCAFTDDDDYPMVIIKVGMAKEHRYTKLSELYPELRDVVRHELEHLTQRGMTQKVGKECRNNDKIREKIMRDELPQYRYFTLEDEVDANIHGLYSKAKVLKKPFQIVIDTYLDNLIDKNIIEKDDRKKIYKVWKKRIPKIGGIPKLK